LIGRRKTKTVVGGLGGETRGPNKVELTRMVWDKWEKEEGWGRMARKMRTGEEIQPRILLKNNYPSTTPTICPGPKAGSLLMIHVAPQCCKRAHNSEFNKPGFSSAGLSATPSQPLLH
jgi:hypothetical protein